jgi:hypothetical protein
LEIFDFDLALSGGNRLVKSGKLFVHFTLENLILGNLILSTSYLFLELGLFLCLGFFCSSSGEFLFHFSGNSGLLGGLIGHLLSVGSLLLENVLGSLVDIGVGSALDGNTIAGNGGSVSSQSPGILDDLNVGLHTISLSSVFSKSSREFLDFGIALLHLLWISDGIFLLNQIVKSSLGLVDLRIKDTESIFDFGNFCIGISDETVGCCLDNSKLVSVRTGSSE